MTFDIMKIYCTANLNILILLILMITNTNAKTLMSFKTSGNS